MESIVRNMTNNKITKSCLLIIEYTEHFATPSKTIIFYLYGSNMHFHTPDKERQFLLKRSTKYCSKRCAISFLY